MEMEPTIAPINVMPTTLHAEPMMDYTTGKTVPRTGTVHFTTGMPKLPPFLVTAPTMAVEAVEIATDQLVAPTDPMAMVDQLTKVTTM